MRVDFDATGHQPQSFDPIPAGWQPLAMVEGLEKPSSTVPNTYYAAVFEVMDGPYKGRKLFHNFNFNNTNEQAVKIAYDQLATICHAVGIMKIQQMDDLFGKVLQGKIKVVPAVMEDDGETVKYEPKNEIKGFKPLEDAVNLPGAGAAAGGGLPEGFGDSAAAATAAVATPEPAKPAAAAAVPKAAAAIPAAAKPEPVKKLVMTDKLPGVTAEQFRETDPAWTDEALVRDGYAKWVLVEPEAAAIPKPAAAAIPTPGATAAVATEQASPAADAAAADAGDDETPPWLQNQ